MRDDSTTDDATLTSLSNILYLGSSSIDFYVYIMWSNPQQITYILGSIYVREYFCEREFDDGAVRAGVREGDNGSHGMLRIRDTSGQYYTSHSTVFRTPLPPLLFHPSIPHLDRPTLPCGNVLWRLCGKQGHCGIAAADRSNVAPVADVRVDREAPRPMQEDAAGCSRSPDCVAVNSSGTCLPAPPAAKNDHRSFGVLDVGDITVHDVAGEGIARKGDHGLGGESGDGEEQSVDSLLGSLMRALNTEQGRADFARLTAGDGI